MLEEFWQERKEALGLLKISKQSNPTETGKTMKQNRKRQQLYVILAMQKYLCKRVVLDLDVSGCRASHNLPRIYIEVISATTTVNYIQPYNSARQAIIRILIPK